MARDLPAQSVVSERAPLAGNLQALEIAQPGLVIPSGSASVRRIDGVWRLVDGDRTLAIHSRDPQREADRLAAELLAGEQEQALVVTVGLGLGFLPDALERRGWAGKILALEPEPDTLRPLLERRDWRRWIGDGRLRVLLAPDYAGAMDCWQWFGDGSSEPPVLVNPTLAQVRSEAVERARALVKRIQFDAKANAEARRQHGARYLLNTLANLPALASEADVAALDGAARGFPAIVVGAGPSLDAVLPALREAQASALIIAVDTALRPLLSAGIEPHLVVAVDPGEANVRHLWDLPACPNTHLVAEASVDPVALGSFRGRTFLLSVSDHQPWPWLRTHGQPRGRLRVWGSVLTCAFDLALRMGGDPVVFAGADLAFPGGRPYCRGVAYEEGWRRLAEWGVPHDAQWKQHLEQWPAIEERDVAGGSVRTAAHLVAFRDWLVEQMARERNRRFINATGAGILHGGGIQQASLDEIVSALGRAKASPAKLVRARYRPAQGAPLLAAARKLVAGAAGSGAPRALDADALTAWEQFADGLTRATILKTISRALGSGPPDPIAVVPRAGVADSAFDSEWIVPLAAAVPMVPMPIAAARMEPVRPGVRLFRFRTTAARLIGCVLRLPDGAVAEDGRPLRRGAGIDALAPGEYAIWRDEVYFASTDGSDPRRNRRSYSLVVPPAVAHLEMLPLGDILAHHL